MLFAAICDGCGRSVARRCEACRAELLAGLDVRGGPIVTATSYDGLARRLVLGLKYRGHHGVAEILAESLVCALDVHPVVADLVTWVPTTGRRRHRRGVDHAELIARHVARRTGVRAVGTMVKLGEYRQTGATRERRLEGVLVEVRRRVAGARVLLVDDVVTTGASMRACRAALLAAGAASVACAAVARTPAFRPRR